MTEKGTWVVVADAARARIFETAGPGGRLEEREALAHEPARRHIGELVTDAPGEVFDRAGHGRHDAEPEVDPKTHEALRFARRLAEHLAEARRAGAYRKLVIAAAPRFLGMLREALDEETRAAVAAETPKDLTGLDPAEIRRALPEWW
ncbi:host attachment protein [Inmirania thermothiophila]|uniref:Protein required for attachment to host cells n=1 Tax=Inmirania thermothiophila TaxID=1750597 RepID=A0A3N1YAX1_9GAMM|nr:host attachment protein [Inmirania thermothiophila]ROR34537.1 protein required for attachment to host cells [Inmirania thermothiophila]